jgi:hypothetical protein
MATTTRPRRKPRPQLSDDDLSQVLALSAGSDSVELKLTVPDAGHRSAVAALGLDPLDAQIRLVSFFDTPDLVLNRAGLIVRARRVQGREDDSVIKLRPVVPEQLPDELRHAPGMLVELDAMPGGYVCSASLKARLDNASGVKKRIRGKRATRKLFTKSQRAFYAAHAPDGLELDDLTLLGPIFVLKLNTTPRAFRRKLVTEMWLYPDGSRILELSTKCAPAEMFQVAAEARSFLTEAGVDLSGQQHTKTKTALQQFSKRLGADGGASTGQRGPGPVA